MPNQSNRPGFNFRQMVNQQNRERRRRRRGDQQQGTIH